MSDPYIGESGDRATPGLTGRNASGGDGAFGSSTGGSGVHGETLAAGVVVGRGFLGGIELIKGEPAGVYGESSARGVVGHSDIGVGVFGHSNSGTAVSGEGPAGIGLISGVEPKFGQNAGAFGQADRRGVLGIATGAGGMGVHGAADGGSGVLGETVTGIAVEGRSAGAGLAGKFGGNVEITGSLAASNPEGLHLTTGALRVHGTDLVLDGRSAAAAPGHTFRALVDAGNKLVVNYGGDYASGTEVQSSLQVDGTLTVTGNASVAGTLWVNGGISTTGTAWLYSGTEIRGNANVNGNASVNGNLTLGGNVYCFASNSFTFNADYFHIHGHDLLLDSRSAAAFPGRTFRALVDGTDRLIINYACDYQQGVEIESDLIVDGHVRSHGGDCAEQFAIAADAIGEAGTVMVIGPDGTLAPCLAAYDTRVAGVVSGGGDLKPALILNERAGHRAPIALAGTVYCKVDAGPAPIAAGDLLTTSATPGHAMKAADRASSLGAIIGKALRPVACGTDLIPILVALH